MNKEITLQKNCIATIIPAGDEITLAEGATFFIAQSALSLGLAPAVLRKLHGPSV